MLLAGTAGCLGSDRGPLDLPPVGDEVPGDVVRFLVIGDPGTGGEAQYRVAEAMHTVCQQRGCSFVLVNGDNIYENGVDGPDDPQFVDKFEQPYAAFDIPFYLVLGNHDNGDGAGSDASAGDHEVAYSHRTDRISERWNMPDRYYTFEKGNVEFFAIDSGPAEIAVLPVWAPTMRGPAQQTWLAGAMAQSDADWKIAFAHHPYRSNGVHGDAGTFDGTPGRGAAYEAMLEEAMCPEADVFFAGHDHDLQWLEPAASCPGVELIVSGAAAKTRGQGSGTQHPAHFERYDTNGFLWVEIDGDRFTGVFYDDAATQLYERTFQRGA